MSSAIQKLKELVTSSLSLQDTLKEIHQAEGGRHQMEIGI